MVWSKRLLTSLALLPVLLFAVPSTALLNGQRIVKKSERHPIVSLKIQSNSEITRCTGTFVSQNTVLTAAHCFDSLVKVCSTLSSCSKRSSHLYDVSSAAGALSIDKSSLSSSFKVLRHPRYLSTEVTGYDNYDKSNYDLALIILSRPTKSRSYVRIAKQVRSHGTAWTYGAGMTRAKLYSNPSTGEAYNMEENVGPLKKQSLPLNSLKSRRGLLEVSSSLIGYPLRSHLYDLAVRRGLQVLSADSGGPLIHQNKVIGVIRNFSFSFSPSRQPQSESASFPVTGKSIFTSVTSREQKSFFKLAKKYGGSVSLEN